MNIRHAIGDNKSEIIDAIVDLSITLVDILSYANLFHIRCSHVIFEDIIIL